MPRTIGKLDAGHAVTFKTCAESYIESHRASWRNAKHAAQWDATLAAYVYPLFGALSVQAIGTPETRRVLEPI